MTDKNVRDELAELTEAVRELRDREVADTLRELRAEVEKLRAERAAHQCHGCHCGHLCIHYQTWPAPSTWNPPIYTVTMGSATTGISGYVNTAGCNPAVTTYNITN